MVDVELRAKRDALEYLWRQGLSGQALLYQHSQLIDDYLIRCFGGCPEAGQGMALIALGGYGRRELFPYSDIDLLLLYEPAVEGRLVAVTEALFYPLWDAGIEVGHGVRTVETCLAHAREDFFFQVALLDGRLLAGDASLFESLRAAFRQEIILGHRREFLHNMMRHRDERHQRFGMHGYQLEPNLKESRGGFRDFQAMMWVAQALFGLSTLDDLMENGILSGPEKTACEEAWHHLIKLRNRLHYLSSRKNDRLFFEHQEEMAKALRYHSGEGILAVERFMGDVYRHLHAIATTSDLFFEHVDESLGTAVAKPHEHVLEPGIVARHGRLHLAEPEMIGRKPSLLMRLFVQAGRTGLPVHHRSRKLVTENLGLIDDRLRHSKRMAKGFFDILENASDVLAVLSAMLDTGLLTAYLPEFAQVRSLAQHDIYHINTVDRHLLQTVAELRRLNFADTPTGGVESPHLLLLAALLHDIGKGHREDHSQRGGQLVEAIGKRLGLQKPEASCLRFLVEQHLFLTVTALRRDLEDDAFILQCADQIGTPDRLTMLYLLSVADAKATGPTAWNEWKAALLLELTLKISILLERTDLRLPDRSQGAAWMLERLREHLPAETRIDRSILPEEYLLSFQPAEIARHLALHAELQHRGKAIVEAADQGIAWSVLVIAPDSTGLLAKICGTLALHGLNVVSAQIFTWADGVAVDVLNVRPGADQSFEALDWQALAVDLNLAIKNQLGLAHRLVTKFRSQLPSASAKVPQAPPRVVMDNDASAAYTIVEVHAASRPGLLYDITRTLAEFGIDIHRAKIATDGERAVDVFYVLDNAGAKVETPLFQEEISTALLYIAGGEPGRGVRTQ
ncbi:MAG: [protein-PII] uridylyltransferase [Thermodesulfobacteriota bacterium]